MKSLAYFFIGMTAFGFFLLAAGAAGSHGHLSFRPHRGEDWIMFGIPLLGIAGLVFVWAMRDHIHKDTVQSKIQGSITYHELMTALYLAIEKLDSLERRRSGSDAPIAELKDHLLKARSDLCKSDFTALENLRTLFAPTGAWDDAVGEEGMDLANKVFELTEKLNG